MKLDKALILINGGYRFHRIKWTKMRGLKHKNRHIFLNRQNSVIPIWTYLRGIVVPWYPTRSDISSDDWEIYDGPIFDKSDIVLANWQNREFKAAIDKQLLGVLN